MGRLERQKQILCEDDNQNGNCNCKGRSRGDSDFLAVRLRARVAACSAGVAMLLLGGCGYHQVGAASHIPAGVRTLNVPIFASKVQAYNTETLFTSAVIRELNTRTRYKVISGNSSTAADATLEGTILAETVAPLTYDATSGQTSSYLVSVTAKVQLAGADGSVLYANDAFAWRQQYQSTQDLSGFVQEDSPAVRRMSHEFAEALVSDMLESFK